MKFQNFTLDRFQEESISSVEKNNSVIVSAPTGSGKTLIADYIIDKDLKEGKRVIYTAPIKALSNQKFKDFTKQYGEDKIGLITGDVVINSTAQVLIMTAEVYRNMAIVEDPLLDSVSYCIMDEVHYISDEERGYIWEESIIFSPEHIRFLFLSATIPNSKEFARWVETTKHHKVDVVKHHVRPVPLERKFYDSDLGITTLEKIRAKKELDRYTTGFKPSKGGRGRRAKVPPPDFRWLIKDLKKAQKLPCIYFVFSRAKTQDY
ncbi:MAG: DEAD/DEAH box helicase, partial [Candidatus Hydrothermarchaeales archaeon]